MIILSGLGDVNFYLVSVVHLLLDVLVHVSCNPRLVGHIAGQGHDSLGGAIMILTEIAKVLIVDVIDGDLEVDLVHGGVSHDVQDHLLLGQLAQLVAVGGIGKLFCRKCEEKLFLEVLDG